MDNIRILIAEDDAEISRLIADALRREGFSAECVCDGAEALRLFFLESYQMVILDLMMPKVDGFEVLRQIRAKNITPVLILSARGSETDKIVGLGLGADDYLSKPFGVGELVARVRAQLRRSLKYSSETCGPEILARHGIVMNTSTYEVSVRGSPVVLTAKEFEILRLFLQNPNRVFTKVQLFRSVWGEAYIQDENTVMVHICRLREKIEKKPADPLLIKTVWGIGYKLAEE